MAIRDHFARENDLGYVSALLTDGAREVRFERMAGG
jgi:hypothetical protein